MTLRKAVRNGALQGVLPLGIMQTLFLKRFTDHRQRASMAATPTPEPPYSILEEWLNGLTHGIGVALSIAGTVVLIVAASMMLGSVSNSFHWRKTFLLGSKSSC